RPALCRTDHEPSRTSRTPSAAASPFGILASAGQKEACEIGESEGSNLSSNGSKTGKSGGCVRIFETAKSRRGTTEARNHIEHNSAPIYCELTQWVRPVGPPVNTRCERAGERKLARLRNGARVGLKRGREAPIFFDFATAKRRARGGDLSRQRQK